VSRTVARASSPRTTYDTIITLLSDRRYDTSPKMPANIEYFHYRFARAPRSRRVRRVRRAWRGRDARAGERRHRRARAWIQALETLDETRVRVCARYTSIQKYFYPVATLPVRDTSSSST